LGILWDIKIAVIQHTLKRSMKISESVRGFSVFVFFYANLLVSLGRQVNMKIIEFIFLNPIRMLAMFAVISAQAEELVRVYRYYAKNDGEIQPIAPTLPQDQSKIAPIIASYIQIILFVTELGFELNKREAILW
jgi:hypothetical protein